MGAKLLNICLKTKMQKNVRTDHIPFPQRLKPNKLMPNNLWVVYQWEDPEFFCPLFTEQKKTGEDRKPNT